MKKTIVVSALTTLTVLLAVGALGVFAARTAVAELEPAATVASMMMRGHGFHGGLHGRADPCARLTEEHINGHAAELHRWVLAELTLDDGQAAALSDVTSSLAGWARDLKPVCELPLADAPQHVAAVVQFAQTTDQALQRFAAAFGAFYETLDADQRAKLNGWFDHEHRSES